VDQRDDLSLHFVDIPHAVDLDEPVSLAIEILQRFRFIQINVQSMTSCLGSVVFALIQFSSAIRSVTVRIVLELRRIVDPSTGTARLSIR
jgi:hypothetical protein